MRDKIAEESYFSAKTLEASIDFSTVNGDKKLFCEYENILREVFKLYQKAVKHGKNEACIDMENTAILCQFFQEFNKQISQSQFRYISKVTLGDKAKYPLSYGDLRLKPLFRFLLQIPNIGELPDLGLLFTLEYMKISVL